MTAREILARRARALATPPPAPERRDMLDLVAFGLAGESYGLEASFVRRVFLLKEVTSLPGLPPGLAGVTNLAGEILPVLDLRRLFKIPPTVLGERNLGVALSDGGRELILLCDSLTGLKRLPADRIRPETARGDLVRGVTGDLLIVLDGPRLLSLFAGGSYGNSKP